MRRGIRAVTGMELPLFPKRRFQAGIAAAQTAADLFPADPRHYRRLFQELWAERGDASPPRGGSGGRVPSP